MDACRACVRCERTLAALLAALVAAVLLLGVWPSHGQLEQMISDDRLAKRRQQTPRLRRLALELLAAFVVTNDREEEERLAAQVEALRARVRRQL